MSIKKVNKFLRSDLSFPALYFVLVILGSYILFNKPLLILPAAIFITLLSLIVYKREIMLPERDSPKAWIASCFFIMMGLIFLSFIKRQDMFNLFGELYIDGEIKNIDRLQESDVGNEYWEEVSVFIPASKKGARLLSFIEYTYWGVNAFLLFANYKLLDYESEKIKSELWFISDLSKYFENSYNWAGHAVPTYEFLALLKFYSTLNNDNNWQLKQKLNFQLSAFKIEHYKDCGKLPDCWKSQNKSCLFLAEIIIANTVVHFKPLKSKITQSNQELPYEKSLIVKAIAYYIYAIKKNFKESGSRSEKIGLISQLYKLFYFVQDHIKAPGGKQTRNLKTVINEDIFNPVTTAIIVDDHKLFRTGVKNFISQNHTVLFIKEAENGQQLAELLRNTTADVISLGIQMPVMDGLTFLGKFNYQEEPKIITLSFLNDSSVVLRALFAGTSCYIDKSQGGEAIAKAYKQVHAYGFYYSSNIRVAVEKLNVG